MSAVRLAAETVRSILKIDDIVSIHHYDLYNLLFFLKSNLD
jgi:hypothetical protein